MYTRITNFPNNKSFFLFGPRGTGKTTWLRAQYPKALYLDLLDSETYYDLLARPNRLASIIPTDWKEAVVIDEVQRVPELLHEVHKLIESRQIVFILTGSSARKLKRGDVNLLAGRALTSFFFPLTVEELGIDFDIRRSLSLGHLPSVFREEDPWRYLESYITTYLREEIQQEGLTRNLGAFSRFLEAASFSQAQILNIAAVARECAINQKVAENYFYILEDLLIADRLAPFTKRAKRRVVSHSKFFFFDCGVYRALRPKGILDTPEEIDGAALETLVYQELKAFIHHHNLDYQLYFWRTAAGREVDFVLYGPKGLIGIEVKRNARITDEMFAGLRLFKKEYPMARMYLLNLGDDERWNDDIKIMPVQNFLKNLKSELITG